MKLSSENLESSGMNIRWMNRYGQMSGETDSYQYVPSQSPLHSWLVKSGSVSSGYDMHKQPFLTWNRDSEQLRN